jgi:hypothetical protein
MNRSANPVSLEPTSPELALVDPALARADLQRLRALELAPRLPSTWRPEPAPTTAAEKRHMWTIPLQILLALSLGANGFALARAVAREDAPAAASLPTTMQPPASRTTRRGALVEQKLLARVVQSPGGKLPAALIDRNTGLAENNLQAACHGAQASSFLCVVRPAQATGAAAYVRYVPNRNGSGTFTWIRNPASVSPQPAPEHPRR